MAHLMQDLLNLHIRHFHTPRGGVRIDVHYLYRELSYGTLSRTLTLPEGLDTEQINAEYNDGLLEITAPVAAAALPRQVEIKGLPKAKAA